MKFKVLILIAICTASIFSTAHAAIGSCSWRGAGSQNKISYNVIAPAEVSLLGGVPIGGRLGISGSIRVWTNTTLIVCALPTVPYALSVSRGELAQGFTDVYKTGIPGVGVRFLNRNQPNSGAAIPFTVESPTNNGLTVIGSLSIEYIRIGRDVAQGTALMDYTIQFAIDGWNAVDINIGGSTILRTQEYFSGCSGIDKLNIPMGRVSVGDFGTRQQSFNLDVLCSGGRPGRRVPVRVYFEGSSDGPGRLNLEPGGAQGVEISLVNNRGVRLPFAQGSAMNMTWTRSEPNGELYRLPVVAEYARKASERVRGGAANATLNYILEYN